MKLMKYLGLLLFTIGFTQCASTQFEQKPPFTITSATYTNWVGGVKGVSGINVNIIYKAEADIAFDSIYFNGRKTKVSFKKNNNETSILGQFNTSTINSKQDLQLHSDPAKEFGNKPHKPKQIIPFDLKDNEAIVSYKVGNKTNYYKIKNVQKGKPVFMQ